MCFETRLVLQASNGSPKGSARRQLITLIENSTWSQRPFDLVKIDSQISARHGTSFILTKRQTERAKI
jgi:hypothetical protein